MPSISQNGEKKNRRLIYIFIRIKTKGVEKFLFSFKIKQDLTADETINNKTHPRVKYSRTRLASYFGDIRIDFD